MPPLKPVPDVARLVQGAVMGGVNIANVFHIKRTGGWTQSALDSQVSLFRLAFKNRFLSLVDGAYVMGACAGVDLSSETGVASSASGSDPGTATGVLIPANCAVCVTWKIARHYRGGHPRTYFAGASFPAGPDTINTIPAAQVTAWAAAAASFLTDINNAIVEGSNVNMVCVHRYRESIQLATPLTSVITGSAVDSRLDSQRRRLGKDRPA